MRRLLLLVAVLLSLLIALCGASTAAAFISTGDGGWVWQNPLPQGDEITAVDFIDTDTGWAVGGWLERTAMTTHGHGVVLQTRDGGLTWQSQYRGAHRLNDVCFIDANVGWAVGGGGTILKTTDGGETWQAQTSGSIDNLASVDFVDAKNGWAVAGPPGRGRQDDLVLHTADGGATWETQLGTTQLSDIPLCAVDFVSITTGWAVGDGGLILQTTDGGVTWTATWSGEEWGPGSQLNAVVFLDATTGWAAGDDGTILRTTDAGVTWSPQAAGTSGDLEAITFAGPTSGWAVGDRGVVLHTVDAGTSWVAQDSGTTTGLTDVDFVSDTEGWTGGEILHTTTAGSLWTPQSSSVTRQDLAAVDFVDLLHGWAVGAAGTIVHTADAGASWTLQASTTTEALRAVDFVDPWNGWAVGGTDPDSPSPGTRIILHTGDGGLTWEPQFDESGYPLQDVQFVDSLSGWAAGTGAILHTADGGATWSRQYAGFAACTLSFVSTSVGWAASDRGGLVRTTDGGATWETQRIPLAGDPGYAERIHDIDFVNETTGWAAGGSYVFTTGSNTARLFQTTDGGATWQRRMYLDSRGPLTSVYFLDDAHCWAVGDWGSALHTIDGGSTWQAEETGAGPLLNSVCFVSATDGWAVGSGGAILHTVTGGLPDTKPPVTSQEGADDLWHNGERTVTFSAVDPDAANSSGVAYTEYAVDGGHWTEGTELTVPAPADHSNDGIHAILFRSRDCVGNLEPSQSCRVKIDTAAPTISLNSPWDGATFVRDQAVMADWSVSDAFSGVDSASGTVASGALIDTASRGRKSFTVGASDAAGNSASRTVRYRVPFVSAGVLPPLSPTETRVLRGGCTPVAFRIFNVRGRPVRKLAPVLHLAKLSDGLWGSEFDPTSSSQPKNSTVFRYDPWAMRYVYNLNTKALAVGTYRLRIDLGNGGEMIASFSLR